MKEKELKPCYMCDNARVNSELTDDNDLSYISVGKALDGFNIMIGAGNNRPLRIEFEKWDKTRNEMVVVGRYYPDYCPNCGRKIQEYGEVNQ